MAKQALTESYILKKIERKAAACLTAFMHDMGGYTNWQAGAWKDSVAGHLIDDSKWRKKGDRPPPYCMFTRNRANGKTNWSHHDHRHDEYIAFANPRYGDGGKIWRGPLQQVQEVEVNDDGKSKVFTNFTDDPVNISYEEEVSLEHSDESHFDSEWALDVTTTASQEVGGSYLGVEAKATFEESVGVHTGGSKGGASSDTEGLSDTVSINFDLQPGEVVRVDIFKHQSRTRQDYSIDACFDFDFHFKWVHWSSNHGNAKHRGGHEYITVQGVAGLQALIAGQDTDHPSFEGYKPVSRVRNGLNWIMNPQNRWIKFSGTDERVIENNVDYKLEQLHQDAIPQGIEVVNMSQEENQAKYGG